MVEEQEDRLVADQAVAHIRTGHAKGQPSVGISNEAGQATEGIADGGDTSAAGIMDGSGFGLYLVFGFLIVLLMVVVLWLLGR